MFNIGFFRISFTTCLILISVVHFNFISDLLLAQVNSYDQPIIGEVHGLPDPPQPDLKQGFYINAEGDSVYRSIYSGDHTVKGLLKKIRHFEKSVPNEYIDSKIIGISDALSAFNNEELTYALIDADTRGY